MAIPAPAWAEQTACDPETPRYVAEEPAVFAQLGIKEVWPLSRGEGVRVAVVDSGVASANAHLGEAVDPGHDLVGSGDGRTDVYGHGTAIAGQIAARQVKGSGLLGLAPHARIVPVRVYESLQERAARPDPGRTARGIRWAADQPGVRIIVVAMSTEADEPELAQAVEYATGRGALVVASTGNADSASKLDAPVYPAAYPGVLAVTAVDAVGQPSKEVLHGNHVLAAAPGAGVLTTFLAAGDCVMGDRPSSSYAAGYAAGIAALVAAAYPDESPADWRYRLLATAVRPASAARSPFVGWGILSPGAALNFINDGTLTGPPNPRFPAPSPPPVEILASPDPVPDHLGRVRNTVTFVVAGVLAIVTAGLLALRLPRPGSSQQRPRDSA
ncbi:MAG: S8 family serine peptidase [Propionibacteriaceae bacterium]|nr:S8 family serine peptidase [Propionibacteriaceae bacterium]